MGDISCMCDWDGTVCLVQHAKGYTEKSINRRRDCSKRVNARNTALPMGHWRSGAPAAPWRKGLQSAAGGSG